MSANPFRADPAIRSRHEGLDATVGPAVRAAVMEGLIRTRREVATNLGGVLLHEDVHTICSKYGLSSDDLMLLSLNVAEGYARPPISHFTVGAVGREAETGDLIFGGNLEFSGAHIANTVHGEGFVFTRAFSRGTSVTTIALGEAHPCAHCRQYLSEFAATAQLTLIDPLGYRLNMAELYPWPFDPAYLGETGVVACAVRQPELEVAGGAAPATALRLTALGRRSYVPYGKSPAAIVLALRDGRLIGGAAIESVAFNPTMSPLQAALIDLFAHGYEPDDIASATMAADPAAAVDYVTGARALLAAIAPTAMFETVAWA